MKNQYRYMIIDGSYFLTRNYMVLRNYDNFKLSELAKSFTQSLVKIYRDFVSADKMVIAWDKWDETIEGYYRNQLVDFYKADRKYETEEGLEKLKTEPGVTEEELKAYERGIYCNKVKREVKAWIKSELCKFGIPSISLPGYEADDIVKVFCDIFKTDDKKSCIVSKDSDWNYLINPNIDFISGKSGDVITYEDMKHITLPELTTLANYKAIEDSLYGSHNNMMPSIDKAKVKGCKHVNIIRKVLGGDDSFIADKDLYQRNLSTFDIEKFTNYDKLIELVNTIPNIGKLGDINEFNDMMFQNDISIYGTYYYRYLGDKLDKNLYKE